MKIKWLGHSSFLVASGEGKRIITDPYNVGGGISYGPINETADVVTISHDHGDHNNGRVVKGTPQILRGEGIREIEGIIFEGISSHHDPAQGTQRGNNTIFCFAVDGIKLCHLGDLGHELSDEQVADIGDVDILMIPVGGYFTIDARQATALCQSLKSRIVIPMHYKTAKCAYPIATVDEFLKGKSNVRKQNSSEAEYTKDGLPKDQEVVVLQPAL